MSRKGADSNRILSIDTCESNPMSHPKNITSGLVYCCDVSFWLEISFSSAEQKKKPHVSVTIYKKKKSSFIGRAFF